MAHRGDYAIHEIAGGTELVGRDVILVHRLLKNELVKRTGIRDYAVYTAQLARELELDADVLGWRRESETYDDLGEIAVHVDDLSARWERESCAPTHLIPESEGATVVSELPAPRPWCGSTCPIPRTPCDSWPIPRRRPRRVAPADAAPPLTVYTDRTHTIWRSLTGSPTSLQSLKFRTR